MARPGRRSPGRERGYAWRCAACVRGEASAIPVLTVSEVCSGASTTASALWKLAKRGNIDGFLVAWAAECDSDCRRFVEDLNGVCEGVLANNV